MAVSIKDKVVAVAPVQATGTKQPLWRHAIALSFYLIVAIAILELFFKIAGVGQQEFLEPDLQMGCRHIAGKVVTWRLEGYSNDRLNSQGLRDSEHTISKPPGVYRIALLGDSATESLQVDLAQTYGKVLESELNQHLLSKIDKNRAPMHDFSDKHFSSTDNNKHVGGMPCISRGLGMAQPLHMGDHLDTQTNTQKQISNKLLNRFEVINFGCSSYSTGQELLQYRTQVLKYSPDAVVLLFNRGDTTENVLNRSGLDAPEPRPYYFLDEHKALATDNTVLDANFDKLRPHRIVDFLRANSRIYGVFTQTHLSLSLTDSRYRKFRSWLDRAISAVTGKQNSRRSTLTYPQQDGLPVTVSLVKALAEEIRKNRQDFVLMTFPNMIHDAYFESQIAPLRQLAQRQSFSLLDLTAPFLASKQPSDNFLWYHFSPTGHKLVAAALSNLFRPKVFSDPKFSVNP